MDRVRVGLGLEGRSDGRSVPAALAALADRLAALPFVESLHYVVLGGREPGSGGGLFGRYQQRFGTRQSRVEAQYPVIPLAGSGAKCDLLICVGDVVPAIAGLRVWHYRHGSRYGLAGDAVYFRELNGRDPVSSAQLEQVEPDGSRRVLAESHSATEIGWSLAGNQAIPLAKVPAILERALRSLPEGEEFGSLPAVTAPPAQRLPGAAETLGFLAKSAARTLTRRLLFSHQELTWFVAYRRNTVASVSNTGRFSPEGWTILPSATDHFYADPFVLRWQGRDFLFVEDYLYAERKGVLAVMEFGADGPVGEMQRILDCPYHLSYPFVFEEDGQLYLIPETLGSGRIELYRAQQPQGPWTLVKYLQQRMRAADTTLWNQDGLYYFFTSVAEEGVSPNDFLQIFWSESLTGEWRPHRKNPVSADVRRARGAGKFFVAGNRLIRPSQDCSIRYGYACELNEVVRLTPDDYEERPWGRIDPNWRPNLLGTHTLNSNEGWEVIDGQVLRPRYSEKGESLLGRWQSAVQRRLGQQL